MKSTIVSFARSTSNLSLGKTKKKRGEVDDDASVTTFATESPLKYNEGPKLHRAKSKLLVASEDVNLNEYDFQNNSAGRESGSMMAEARDSAPSVRQENTITIRRASSFQGLKQRFERISYQAIQRQHQISQSHSLNVKKDFLHGRDLQHKKATEALSADVDIEQLHQLQNTKIQNCAVVIKNKREHQTAPRQGLAYQLSATNFDRQDELLASFLEGTAAWIPTEAQLAGRMVIESMTSQINSMTSQMNSIQEGGGLGNVIKGTSDENDDDAGDFFAVLRKEIKTTSSVIPRGQDECVFFLGDELEISTCGRPQITEDMGLFYACDDDSETESSKNHLSRRLVAIKEGGTIEEMLESIEMGYEASLIGCGMAQ